MSNDMMKVGGIGAIICILIAITEMVAIVLLWVSPIDYYFAGPHIDLGAGIAWAVGLALISVGAFGLWKQYKTSFPAVIGIVGIVVLALGLIARIFIWLEPGGQFSALVNHGGLTVIGGLGMNFAGVITITLGNVIEFIGIAGILWLELTGVFSILLGIGFLQLRGRTGVRRATMGAGVLMLIAGAMFCAIIPYGFLVTQVLVLIAAMLMAYVFFKAEGIPGEIKKVKEVKEVKVKEAKKIAARPVEEKKPKLEPEEVEEGVLKYIRKHPEGVDVAECAEKLGISEKDVEKAVNALVKKGKLEMG